MRKYDVPAFLSGCVTVLFEREYRENESRDIVYAIDVPDYVKHIIDSEYKDYKIIYDTHLIDFMRNGSMKTIDAFAFLEVANERIIQYQQSKCVISSRMHALIPAMAIGTPVIGIFENISYWFSQLDKYIPLYTVEDINQINWCPNLVAITQRDLIERVFVNAVK